LSIIAESELLSYKKITQKEAKAIASFPGELKIENTSDEIKKFAVQIRKTSSLKLPGCIIAATSTALNIPLVSADKQLSAIEGLDIILYEKQEYFTCAVFRRLICVMY
jgi:predicted nucleic acid-binding protein